eukprot:m.111844 g.111844  ORF g.111844 m.111844 type:complete len:699 (-) comp15399_c0_seq1:176-2272(-)
MKTVQLRGRAVVLLLVAVGLVAGLFFMLHSPAQSSLAQHRQVHRDSPVEAAVDDDDEADEEDPDPAAYQDDEIANPPKKGAGVLNDEHPVKQLMHHDPKPVKHHDPLKAQEALLHEQHHEKLKAEAMARHKEQFGDGNAAKPSHTDREVDLEGPEPTEFEGASPERMHGQVGLKPDGKPGWPLSTRPPTPNNVARELIGNGFYVKLSDSISLDRDVPDYRMPECKNIKFDLDAMPRTSVVIVFFNEAWSPLMRSVHSVLNRSPPKLLKEIVLVDDGSTKPWLQQALADYVRLLPKVRLVRQPERSGLVKARLRGIKEARAETFIVLDSHIEVQPGWLEPLLDNLGKNKKNMIMPQIDSINPETFKPQAGGIGCSLGFIWNLIEHGIQLQKQEEQRRLTETEPIRSPAMAGGLFGGWVDYFWELGGYDEEWGYWGTENLELSFRLWQCGGRLECEPCSRVYHIFRKGGGAYSMPGNHVTKNKLRTLTLWMDEFGWLAQEHLGNPKIDMGPLNKMIALREKLQCKPFKWLLENVFPESPLTDLSDIVARGTVKNKGKDACLDTAYRTSPGSKPHLKHCSASRSQQFMLFKNTGLRVQNNFEHCILPNEITFCDWRMNDIDWKWDPATGLLKHGRLGKCYAAGTTNDDVPGMADCDASNPNHQWELQPFDLQSAADRIKQDAERLNIEPRVSDSFREKVSL